jgi:hypothetical protein
MHVTTEEAVEMYARFLKARYHPKAKKITDVEILQLRAADDIDGERVWTEVGRELAGAGLH